MAPTLVTPIPSRLSTPNRSLSLLEEYLFISPNNPKSSLNIPNVWITNSPPRKRREIAKYHHWIFEATVPDMSVAYNDFIDWGTEDEYTALNELLALKFPGFVLFRGFHRTEEFEGYIESAGCGGVGRIYGTIINESQYPGQVSREAVILFEDMSAVLHEYSHKFKYGDRVGSVQDGLRGLLLKELEK